MIVGKGSAVTVKPVNGGEVPFGVATVRLRVVNSAVEPIVIVAGKLVEVPPAPIVAVTPLPLKVTAVAPDKFVPVIVADTVEPCAPEAGDIPVIDGPPNTLTANAALVALPPSGLVT